jgi:hypothetical protein
MQIDAFEASSLSPLCSYQAATEQRRRQPTGSLPGCVTVRSVAASTVHAGARAMRDVADQASTPLTGELATVWAVMTRHGYVDRACLLSWTTLALDERVIRRTLRVSRLG